MVVEAVVWSNPTPAPSPTPDVTAEQFLASTYWVSPDSTGTWTIGRSGAATIRLPITEQDGFVRLDFGRVVAEQLVGSDWVFSRIDPATGHATELYRRPGHQAVVDATLNSTGTELYFMVESPRLDGDGGLYAVNLATGHERTLVAPTKAAGAGRTALEWSSSGGTLASSVCVVESPCAIDVVDAATDHVRRLPVKWWLAAVSDETVLGYDRNPGPWQVFDLATGRTRVLGTSIVAAERSRAIDGGSFLVSGFTAGSVRYETWLVTPRAASIRQLLSEVAANPNRLVDYGRSAHWAVFGPSLSSYPIAFGPQSLDLLNLDTGTITHDAVQATE